MTARGRAFGKGEIGQVDIDQSHANSVDAPSASQNMVAVTTNGSKWGVLGIFLADVAENEVGFVSFRGFIEGVPLNAAGGLQDRLVAIVGAHKLGAPTVGGQKHIGTVWEVNATGLVAIVEFNGIEGFSTNFV